MLSFTNINLILQRSSKAALNIILRLSIMFNKSAILSTLLTCFFKIIHFTISCFLVGLLILYYNRTSFSSTFLYFFQNSRTFLSILLISSSEKLNHFFCTISFYESIPLICIFICYWTKIFIL